MNAGLLHSCLYKHTHLLTVRKLKSARMCSSTPPWSTRSWGSHLNSAWVLSPERWSKWMVWGYQNDVLLSRPSSRHHANVSERTSLTQERYTMPRTRIYISSGIRNFQDKIVWGHCPATIRPMQMKRFCSADLLLTQITDLNWFWKEQLKVAILVSALIETNVQSKLLSKTSREHTEDQAILGKSNNVWAMQSAGHLWKLFERKMVFL